MEIQMLLWRLHKQRGLQLPQKRFNQYNLDPQNYQTKGWKVRLAELETGAGSGENGGNWLTYFLFKLTPSKPLY